MSKKKLIIYSLSILGVAVSMLALNKGSALAESINNYPPLIQRLITTFKLDTSQVEKVINEQREERQKERTQLLIQRLDQAVSESKITQEQKNTILQKHTEWQASRDQSFFDKTNEERIAQRNQHRLEMQKLESDMGISLREIIGSGRGKNGMRNNWK